MKAVVLFCFFLTIMPLLSHNQHEWCTDANEFVPEGGQSQSPHLMPLRLPFPAHGDLLPLSASASSPAVPLSGVLSSPASPRTLFNHRISTIFLFSHWPWYLPPLCSHHPGPDLHSSKDMVLELVFGWGFPSWALGFPRTGAPCLIHLYLCPPYDRWTYRSLRKDLLFTYPTAKGCRFICSFAFRNLITE